jgi:hypothetical protein
MDLRVASFLSQIMNRQTTSEIAYFLAALTHELLLEEFASLENILLTKIFSLVSSKRSRTDCIAGNFTIESLLDVSSTYEEKKDIKICQQSESFFLSMLLQCNESRQYY